MYCCTKLQSKFIFLFFFICCYTSVKAQRLKPINDAPFLTVFREAEKYLDTDTAKAATIAQKLDSLCTAHEKDYPLYTANIRLWQSWYQFASANLPVQFQQKGNEYMSYAMQKITGREKLFIDSFSLDIKNLGESFRDINSLNLFKDIDKLIRKGCGKNYLSAVNDYTITLYAWQLFNADNIATAANLAQYEKLYLTEITEKHEVADKIGYLFNAIIIVNNRFNIWKNNKNAEDVNQLYQSFKYWLLATEYWLYNPAIKGNKITAEHYSYNGRILYMSFYHKLIFPYVQLAVTNNTIGAAAIELNRYMKDVLIMQVDENKLNNVSDKLPYQYLSDAATTLADIYYNIGEYRRSINCLTALKKRFSDTDNHWIDSLTKNVYVKIPYYYINAKSHKALGNLKLADLYVDVLKAYYPQPSERTEQNKGQWDNYIYARILEITGLLETNRKNQAIDSMLQYYAIIYDNDKAGYPGNHHEVLFSYTIGRIAAEKKVLSLAEDFLSMALTNANKEDFFDYYFYYDLAALYIQVNTMQKKSIQNKELLQTLINYTEEQLKKNLLSLSPDQRIIFYENKLLKFFNLYHSLIAEGYLHNDPKLKEAIIAQSISLKNYLLSGNEILTKLLSEGKYTDNIKQILAVKKRFALTEAEAYLIDPTGLYDSIDDLKDKAEELIQQLTTKQQMDSIAALTTSKKIKEQLSQKDIYIEFIRFNNVLKNDTVMYAAVCLDKNSKGFQFITLFKETELLTVFNNKSSSPQLKELYNPKQRGVSLKKKKEDNASDKSQPESSFTDKLGSFIFDSLQQVLNGKEKIIFIPDGYLNRISYAALQVNNKFLFQQYDLKQLSASRMLFKQSQTTQAINWFLAGGINYGSSDCKNNNSFLSSDISWNYLPGSLKEIKQLQQKFAHKTTATTIISENDFKDSIDLSNYTHIHLATHGFYFDSTEVKTYYRNNVIYTNVQQFPLLRSGIVLSNANCPDSLSKRNNGYLLGYELAAQDLSNCKLITLSACESALGDIKSNLGVMGLQRAIKLAGAKKMLITLWKIPDTETAEFMQLFYDFLFNKANSEEEALKKTQEIMSKKYSVGKWGAFVLIE